VIYSVTNDNELRIEYLATTDKATPVNLTHHGYWKLTGAKRDILDHELMLNADRFTPVDATLIPTGELRPVDGTTFDFRKPTAIGARVSQDNEQLKFGKGYDHNWVLIRKGSGLSLAARASEPTTGRIMEVYTTEPGVQFYAGNFLDGHNIGKGGAASRRSTTPTRRTTRISRPRSSGRGRRIRRRRCTSSRRSKSFEVRSPK